MPPFRHQRSYPNVGNTINNASHPVNNHPSTPGSSSSSTSSSITFSSPNSNLFNFESSSSPFVHVRRPSGFCDNTITTSTRRRRRRTVIPSNSSTSVLSTPIRSTSTGYRQGWKRQPLLTSPQTTSTITTASKTISQTDPFKDLIPHSSTSSPTAMSFRNHNYLAGKVEVEFNNDGIIDMVGCANTGTGYSLSGRVLITLPSLPSSLSSRAREVRDLQLVVEGKSEYWDDKGRYHPLRLWSKTITLATPSAPLAFPATASTKLMPEFTLPFDLSIPGWLPPTEKSDMTATLYGAICHATLGWTSSSTGEPSLVTPVTSLTTDAFLRIDSPSRPPRSSKRLSAISAQSSNTKTKSFSFPFYSPYTLHGNTQEPSLSQTQIIDSTFQEITLRRHRLPQAMTLSQNPDEPVVRHFALKTDKSSTSPVECVVSVPDWVDINGAEKSLKISMRVRAKALPVNKGSKAQNKALPPTPSPTATASTTTTNDDDDPMDGSGSNAGDRPRRTPSSSPMTRQTVSFAAETTTVTAPDIMTTMLELGMEIEETSRFSSTVFPAFTQSFPIPLDQPSADGTTNPLIAPRPSYAESSTANLETFRGFRNRACLLADDGNQRNFFFADGGLGLNDKWRRVNVVLPMPTETEKQRANKPLPELDGPFHRIRHNLKIRIVCRNPDATEDTVVVLSTPIRFGTVPTVLDSTLEPRLPAYIQLFHENGDQRECAPLPLYSLNPDYTTPPPAWSPPNSPTTRNFLNDIASTSSSAVGSIAERRSLSVPPPPILTRTSADSAPSEDDSMDLDNINGPEAEAEGEGGIEDIDANSSISSSEENDSLLNSSGASTAESDMELPTSNSSTPTPSETCETSSDESSETASIEEGNTTNHAQRIRETRSSAPPPLPPPTSPKTPRHHTTNRTPGIRKEHINANRRSVIVPWNVFTANAEGPSTSQLPIFAPSRIV